MNNGTVGVALGLVLPNIKSGAANGTGAYLRKKIQRDDMERTLENEMTTTSDKCAGRAVLASSSPFSSFSAPISMTSTSSDFQESGQGATSINNAHMEDQYRQCRPSSGVISCRTSVPLSQPHDALFLSDMYCFVRKQLEAFVVGTSKDGKKDDNLYNSRDSISAKWPGRVGIRCVHCSSAESANRKAGVGQDEGIKSQKRIGASSFPKSIRLVYQCVRNFQRYHIMKCPNIPPELKEEYARLKLMPSRSHKDAPKYWEESCRSMGMIDGTGGLFGEEMIILGGDGRFFVLEDGNSSGLGNLQQIEDQTKPRSSASNDQPHLQNREAADRNGLVLSSCVPTGAPRIADVPAKNLSVAQGKVNFRTSEEQEASGLANNLDVQLLDRHRNSSSSPEIHQPSRKDTRPNTCESRATGHSFSKVVLTTEGKVTTDSDNNNRSDSSIQSLENGFDRLFDDEKSSSASAGNTPFVALSDLSSSDEQVLGLVRLAQSSVMAMGQIQHIGDDYTVGDNSSILTELGAQLYELFSGGLSVDLTEDSLEWRSATSGSLFTGVDTEEKNTSSEPAQRRKRGKQRSGTAPAAADESSSKHVIIPLSELGLPPAVCTLVSTLLGSDDGISGDCDYYRTIEDVSEDLSLMAADPDKYLLRKTAGASSPVSAPTANTKHFHIISPGALYGREKETRALTEAYDRGIGQYETSFQQQPYNLKKEFVLLSGYSGTGKSSIVWNTVDHFVDERSACFVSGKFDAMRQLRPLSAIVSAVDDYCELLAEDQSRICALRKAVLAAIGSEGQAVLASLVPKFRQILASAEEGTDEEDGVSKPVQVHGREAQQRLLFMICGLFRATCSITHPVVLFLDDLQWIDEVSLMMMQSLISDVAVKGLFVIGCYRENEVGADHPLMTQLATIRRLGCANITELSVGHLDIQSVNSLLSDTLRLTPRMTRSLAETVLHKTGGNALFVLQFLVSLQDDGLLRFALASRRWEWDIGQIRNKKIADGVVELMTDKFLRMGPDVIEGLRVASVFGAQCPEPLLQIIDRSPGRVGSTILALDVAVAEGIMTKVGQVYKFAHDQIQQAAYMLIPKSNSELFHLEIGRILWKLSSAEETESHLFVIVDQLQRGSRVVTDNNEKIMIAQLSLMAGEMATRLSAFLPASAFLGGAVGLLDEGAWRGHRQLCFDVYNLYAETEHALGNFESVQRHVDVVLARAESLEEKLRPHHTLLRSLGAQGRVSDAINMAAGAISQLGEDLPLVHTEKTVKNEIGKTLGMLSALDDDSLTNLKTMDSAEKNHVMKFLHELVFLTFMEKRSFFPIPVCRMFCLSVTHGVCRESAVGFAYYGAIQCVALNQFSEGYRFGKLALRMTERFQAKDQLAKVLSVVYGWINHWTEPVQSCLPPLRQGVEAGMSAGDTEHAIICASVCPAVQFGSGQNLDLVLEETEMFSQQMLTHNYLTHVQCTPLKQTVLHLLGRSTHPLEMKHYADEDSLSSSEYADSNHFTFVSNSATMWLQYIFGRYRSAWTECKTGRWQTVAILIPTWCYNTFFSCLTGLALARIDGEREYSDTIERTMAQMTTWARSTPWNCRNKLELMKAEYAYFKGDFTEAVECYELSVELARKHRFVHEQGLALERFGIFHLEVGNHDAAHDMFVRARDCYNDWGAVSKVAHIEGNYI
eukprot:CAMPEP_0197443254 /NCGR_PEP_ID=MMETSP1175-20131217/9033_1 /TAXON_ID=1003142 /ORGANISM="Triceratium dubium, Strain CCMP147" /LENGTH=1664 /DNA_ID=CAMNT_0042973857 /DNA_START=161 /DNA_END=5156 /DNA_ORIENTATION=+